jgi:hypothetical protein
MRPGARSQEPGGRSKEPGVQDARSPDPFRSQPPYPSVASVTSVQCFSLAGLSRAAAGKSSPRPSSMGMPRNFRSAFTNQKVQINSLVRLQDVIEKQSVPSTRRRFRRDPFGFSSSKFFV